MEYIHALNAKVGSVFTTLLRPSPPTEIDVDAAPEVWLLCARAFNARRALSLATANQSFEELKTEFIKRESKRWLRFTYRSRFSVPIGGSGTDSGWGCTGRSSQMLLANCLALAHLDLPMDSEEDVQALICHFHDDPSAAFSIHAISALSVTLFDKAPTEWLGPASVSRILEILVNQNSHLFKVPIRAHVVSDGMIPSDDMLQMLRESTVLLLLPLRLGVDKLNPDYRVPLLSMFTIPQFVGFIGGHQSSSYYFVGAEIPKNSSDSECFFLDPHVVQDCDTTRTQTYRVAEIGKMSSGNLDPSLSLGFFLRDQTEWDLFTSATRVLWSSTEFPLFTILTTEDSLKLQDDLTSIAFAEDDFEMDL